MTFLDICASISILNETSTVLFPNEGFSFSPLLSKLVSLTAPAIALFSQRDIFERKYDLKSVFFFFTFSTFSSLSSLLSFSTPPQKLLDFDFVSLL